MSGPETLQSPPQVEQRELRNLDTRYNDGLNVSLDWIVGTEEVQLSVVDTKNNKSFVVDVAGHLAHDALHHSMLYEPTDDPINSD